MARSAETPLVERLRAELERAQLTWAGWHPDVAAHLFDHGFRPTARALSRRREPAAARDAFLGALWRLQMESVGMRSFGVSSDAWRDNPAYPDRFFPILWLDVMPRLAPLLPPERRLATLAALFNLGENLTRRARGVAAHVAERLTSDVERIADQGVAEVVRDALAELGLLDDASLVERSRSFRKLGPPRWVDLTLFDSLVLPGAVGFEPAAWWVADRVRPTSLVLSGDPPATRLVQRRDGAGARPTGLPFSAEWEGGILEVALDGAVHWCPNGEQRRQVGELDPRGVLSVAASPIGALLISRRFSQRVELRRLAT